MDVFKAPRESEDRGRLKFKSVLLEGGGGRRAHGEGDPKDSATAQGTGGPWW